MWQIHVLQQRPVASALSRSLHCRIAPSSLIATSAQHRHPLTTTIHSSASSGRSVCALHRSTSPLIPQVSAQRVYSTRARRRSSSVATTDSASTASTAPKPFASLSGLPPALLHALESNAITEATDIQSQAYATLLSGASALLASHTGSGKTLAYLVPLLSNLLRDEAAGVRTRLNRPRALILVPNRELAVQVLSICKSLARSGVAIRSLASTGFIPLRKLSRALENPVDLLVLTPGRLEFLLASQRIFLTDLKYVVLDESDTLLSPEHGFVEGIERSLLAGVRFKQKEAAAAAAAKGTVDSPATPPASSSSSSTALTVTPVSGVQVIFCSASITPPVENYVTSNFPSSIRIHTNTLHHLPRSLLLRNIILSNQDKTEVLWDVLQKESQSYRQRLMHNRSREQNKQDLAKFGGNERLFIEDLVRKDSGSRFSGASAATATTSSSGSSSSGSSIRDQLNFKEEEQHHEEDHPPFLQGEKPETTEAEQQDDDASDPDYLNATQHPPTEDAVVPGHKEPLFLPLPPTVIFCNTVSCCRAVAWFLTEKGLNVGHYHGLMPSHYRTAHFKNFLSGETQVLVATDLFSRGLDTTFVQHVVHFDFPFSVLDFIHRVGRTARNGAKGKSTALLGKRDRVLADAIDRLSARGLSIEQLSGDKARYGPDGLPLSGVVPPRSRDVIDRSDTSSSPSYYQGTDAEGKKILGPARKAPRSSVRPAMEKGSQPRRRWMRYFAPSERNQHKLLYSHKVATASPELTIGKMRRDEDQPEEGEEDSHNDRRRGGRGKRHDKKGRREKGRRDDKKGGKRDDTKKGDLSGPDPFEFSAPESFKRQQQPHHAKRGSSMSTRGDQNKQQQQQPRQQNSEPARFPSASTGGRRTAPVRPLGPLAHKQKLGAIFSSNSAAAAGANKSSSSSAARSSKSASRSPPLSKGTSAKRSR